MMSMIARLNAHLNESNKLYSILKEKPQWWTSLLSINGVYAEIRKGDIVDVYYEGGRMAELKVGRDGKLKASCHPKYLGCDVGDSENVKYLDCLNVLTSNPESMLPRIENAYSRKNCKKYNPEEISEKKIQGDMICKKSPVYLDSEFAHRYEYGSRKTIRFDLVAIRDNKLFFIELKRIGDNRMLDKIGNTPEIIRQMDKYCRFIKTNSDALVEYYKKLYRIKQQLGLPVPQCDLDKLTICTKPHLVIRNTYLKETSDRNSRINNIVRILLEHRDDFTFAIEGNYHFDQLHIQRTLLEQGFFDGAKGGGIWHGHNGDKKYPHILLEEDVQKNFYRPIRDEVVKYFHDNGIKWWGAAKDDGSRPSGHILSSQIACLNHLFCIRKDKEAALALINGIEGMPAHFKEVLPIPSESEAGCYIAFEMVSSRDYLNEDGPTRGANCTSVDAFIYATDDNGERWLIPIEWKYTESYQREDKSAEDYKGRGQKGKHGKGEKRLSRYSDLINSSEQLIPLPDYHGSIYFQEPFYQLMRQTLWAEQICRSKDESVIPAQHFVHVHVCPKDNALLLDKNYTEVSKESGMENAWKAMLKHRNLYILIDPKDLMRPLHDTHKDLCNYLSERYWKSEW